MVSVLLGRGLSAILGLIIYCMANIIGDGPVPKKIPGFMHYLLLDIAERIVRLESGITMESLGH